METNSQIKCFYWESLEEKRLNIVAVFATSEKEARKRIQERESDNSTILSKLSNTLLQSPLELSDGMAEITLRLINTHVFVCDKTFETTVSTNRYYRYTPTCLVYLLGVKTGPEKKLIKIEIDFDECFE